MSEIRNIPDVKDASGIFKFDGAKKNGLPEHPWDDDYDDLYAEKDQTSSY